MTTIVADMKIGYMAADRRVTSNDGEVMLTCPTKIERLEIGGDTYLVGLAGLEGPGLVFMEWLENGDWDEPPEPMLSLDEEEAFSILILTSGHMWIVDKFMRMTPLYDRWYGIGSGGLPAWAVLRSGCGGVVKAMETACAMDPNSGDGFEVAYLDGTIEEYSAEESSVG